MGDINFHLHFRVSFALDFKDNLKAEEGQSTHTSLILMIFVYFCSWDRPELVLNSSLNLSDAVVTLCVTTPGFVLVLSPSYFIFLFFFFAPEKKVPPSELFSAGQTLFDVFTNFIDNCLQASLFQSSRWGLSDHGEPVDRGRPKSKGVCSFDVNWHLKGLLF